MAIIKVGAATETEMKEKKARVEDAMHATKAAVEEGIVPGGGVALLRASKVLQTLKLEGDEQIGVNIIIRAIEEPMRWIATNAGHEGSIVVQRVKEMKDEEGFNAQTEQYENLVAGGRDRSDQGGPLGAAERRVDRVAAADDRSGHLADSGKEHERRDAGGGGWAGCTERQIGTHTNRGYRCLNETAIAPDFRKIGNASLRRRQRIQELIDALRRRARIARRPVPGHRRSVMTGRRIAFCLAGRDLQSGVNVGRRRAAPGRGSKGR